jgi:hypothetical protein
MDGKRRLKLSNKDLADPFNAGQMVGMLVMLTFIEKNKDIPENMLDELKQVTANNAQIYLQKPTEDIFLLVDNLVKEM